MPPSNARTGPDPADAQALAEERFSNEQVAVIAAAHDINARTHVGHYPQRPDYRLGDTRTADSYEALKASLPEEAGTIEPDGQGNWVRFVPVRVGQERDQHGVVYDLVEDTPRFVALSQEMARAASADGRETDWWNGYTWMRRGYKPEKDPNTMAVSGAQRRVRRERADAETQALVERDDLRKAAAAPLIPRAASDADAPDARKGKE